jgi:hypothetical protein
MAATHKEVHALHRYLIWSIHMREQCFRLRDQKVPDDPVEKRLWLIRPFMWLALLYVVAEGYQELGLSDPAIDKMLASPHLNLLRVFETGHFTTSATISILGSLTFSRQTQ